MKVLVTGATGFLGNNIVRLLIDDGLQVATICRSTSNLRSLDGLPVDKIEGDLTDVETLKKALRGADAVIHSAALIHIGWRQLAESRAVNVEATRQLANMAAQNQIRMIHVSTVDVLAYSPSGQPCSETDLEPKKPQCSYVVSKTEAEQVVNTEISQGLEAVIVRPGFMVGPWDWKPSSGQMMLAVAKGVAFLAPGGGCSVVDVRDVARGCVSAITRGEAGESYNLAGENMSYFDLWTKMASACGRRGPVARMGNLFSRLVGAVTDCGSFIVRREGQVNSAAVSMGQLNNFYASAKAKEQLNYKIGPIDEALSDAWSWFREYGYAK